MFYWLKKKILLYGILVVGLIATNTCLGVDIKINDPMGTGGMTTLTNVDPSKGVEGIQQRIKEEFGIPFCDQSLSAMSTNEPAEGQPLSTENQADTWHIKSLGFMGVVKRTYDETNRCKIIFRDKNNKLQLVRIPVVVGMTVPGSKRPASKGDDYNTFRKRIKLALDKDLSAYGPISWVATDSLYIVDADQDAVDYGKTTAAAKVGSLIVNDALNPKCRYLSLERLSSKADKDEAARIIKEQDRGVGIYETIFEGITESFAKAEDSSDSRAQKLNNIIQSITRLSPGVLDKKLTILDRQQVSILLNRCLNEYSSFVKELKGLDSNKRAEIREKISQSFSSLRDFYTNNVLRENPDKEALIFMLNKLNLLANSGLFGGADKFPLEDLFIKAKAALPEWKPLGKFVDVDGLPPTDTDTNTRSGEGEGLSLGTTVKVGGGIATALGLTYLGHWLATKWRIHKAKVELRILKGDAQGNKEEFAVLASANAYMRKLSSKQQKALIDEIWAE